MRSRVTRSGSGDHLAALFSLVISDPPEGDTHVASNTPFNVSGTYDDVAGKVGFDFEEVALIGDF